MQLHVSWPLPTFCQLSSSFHIFILSAILLLPHFHSVSYPPPPTFSFCQLSSSSHIFILSAILLLPHFHSANLPKGSTVSACTLECSYLELLETKKTNKNFLSFEPYVHFWKLKFERWKTAKTGEHFFKLDLRITFLCQYWVLIVHECKKSLHPSAHTIPIPTFLCQNWVLMVNVKSHCTLVHTQFPPQLSCVKIGSWWWM